MRISARKTPVAAAILWFASVAVLTGMAGTTAANEDRVNFVENVRCNAGVCEAQRKTIPVVETVREREAPGFCVEYTRRLTGFKTYPSVDPAIPIQVPQFEESERRAFRCEHGNSLARIR